MNENNFNSGTGSQQDYQSSQDGRREYENPGRDNSSQIDDRNMATPQEFPERRQDHDYKIPSGNQRNNIDDDDVDTEEDDEDTDNQIFDEDGEDEVADPVDEQSIEPGDRE